MQILMIDSEQRWSNLGLETLAREYRIDIVCKNNVFEGIDEGTIVQINNDVENERKTSEDIWKTYQVYQCDTVHANITFLHINNLCAEQYFKANLKDKNVLFVSGLNNELQWVNREINSNIRFCTIGNVKDRLKAFFIAWSEIGFDKNPPLNIFNDPPLEYRDLLDLLAIAYFFAKRSLKLDDSRKASLSSDEYFAKYGDIRKLFLTTKTNKQFITKFLDKLSDKTQKEVKVILKVGGADDNLPSDSALLQCAHKLYCICDNVGTSSQDFLKDIDLFENVILDYENLLSVIPICK